MADSFVDYGTGGTLTSDQESGTFTGITFDYLSITHFEVILTNGSGGSHTTTDVGDKTTLTYAASSGPFTVTTDPSVEVQLDFDNISGWTGLADGDTVRIQRSTPKSALQRTFADGSVLKASDLNAQNRQLLFSLQETTDQGIGSLPLDTDLRFDANNRQIKNLGTPTQEHHAVTKAYVDTATLYPGGAPTVDPQAWEFTAADEVDINGADRRYTLVNASAAEENFYLIEVEGVLQLPTSYTVVEISNDEYRLTLLGGASGIQDGALISVRNFGTTRNIATSPFTNPEATPDLDLVVAKSFDSDHTGDHYRAESSDGTAHFRVWGPGSGDLSASNVELKLGANADNNSVNENSIRLEGAGPNAARIWVGDWTGGSETTYGGVLKTENGDRCILAMQGKSTVPDSTLAYALRHGSTQVLSWAYNGDFDTAGDMQVDGVFTVGDINVSATNKSGIEIQNHESDRGILRMQADSTQDPTAYAIQTFSSDTNTFRIDYDGTIRTTGYIGMTGGAGVARYIETSKWTTADDGLTGIIGSSGTQGVIGFTPNGPFLQNAGTKGKALHSGGTSGPYIQTRDNDILIGGKTLSDTTVPARLTYDSGDYGGTQPAWSAMTAYQVPSKKQIDDEITARVAASDGAWQLISSGTFTDSNSFQAAGSGYASYDRVRIEFDSLVVDGDITSTRLWLELQKADGTHIHFDDTEESGDNAGTPGLGTDQTARDGGRFKSGVGDYRSDYPIHGTLEISHHQGTDRPCWLDAKFYCNRYGRSGWVHTGMMGNNDTNGRQPVDRIMFGFGYGSGHYGFASGNYKLYGLNYPTS